MAPVSKVIIVGAGPAGLLLALLLSRADIATTILEQSSGPVHETRAVFYQPVSQFEFERAGILETIRSEALLPRSVAWRDANTGETLFSMAGDESMLALTVGALAGVIQKALEQDQNCKADIRWNTRVTDVGQDEGKAWVEIEEGSGAAGHRLEADFVVGCDGAASIVRKGLFGRQALPGFTHDIQLVAADVRYNLFQDPQTEDSNLFLHPDNAWLAFRPSKHDENMWRFIYRDEPGLEDKDYGDRCAQKLSDLIHTHPSPSTLEIARVRPYKIHQRLVDKMRVGRIVLASDAAHLCCPYGALGLNGGIADVGSLFDCLKAIHGGQADQSILDIYSDVRREKWKTIVDPQSQGMMKLVFSEPKEIYNKPIYKFQQALKANPEMARKNAPNPLALRYDFSKHFATHKD